jgi:hypothetical protein
LTHLRRIETLLGQAIDDLVGKTSGTPGLKCTAMLAEVATELQLLNETMSKALLAAPSRLPGSEIAALVPEVSALLPKINRVERLWANASEFYRAWCAVGPTQSYPSPGYEADGFSPSPALLVFEG